MTVHIREFVLRLGVERESGSGSADAQDPVTQEHLEDLRQELLRELRDSTGNTRPQPFDR